MRSDCRTRPWASCLGLERNGRRSPIPSYGAGPWRLSISRSPAFGQATRGSLPRRRSIRVLPLLNVSAPNWLASHGRCRHQGKRVRRRATPPCRNRRRETSMSHPEAAGRFPGCVCRVRGHESLHRKSEGICRCHTSHTVYGKEGDPIRVRMPASSRTCPSGFPIGPRTRLRGHGTASGKGRSSPLAKPCYSPPPLTMVLTTRGTSQEECAASTVPIFVVLGRSPCPWVLL